MIYIFLKEHSLGKDYYKRFNLTISLSEKLKGFGSKFNFFGDL